MSSVAMMADMAEPGATEEVAGVTKAAQLFHALSDETRLAIVGRLRAGELCVCDLMAMLGAAQSRLSFHLKVLRDAGLVRDRRDGRWVYYALRPEGFGMLSEKVRTLCPKRGKLVPADHVDENCEALREGEAPIRSM